MKKIMALLLASTMACSVLVGCGSKKQELEGTTLNWNIAAEPKTIDPTLNSAVDGAHVINHTFEGLYREFGVGDFQPAVAKDHEVTVNEDGTATYVFHLREDAKWSDGKPVTANDFVFSWRRGVDPKTASEYSYIFSPIVNADEISAGTPKVDENNQPVYEVDEKGEVKLDEKGNKIQVIEHKDPKELAVKADDDYTLEVTLKQDIPYFLELTSFATLSPLREDVVGDNTDGTWAKDPKTAICNGPYNLTEYVLGDHLTLKKSDTYWNKDSITVDNIIGKMIVDGGTILTGFRDGTIDASENPPAGEIPQLIASGEVQVENRIGTNFYVINANTEIPALQNKDVRHALSMAIDREQIVKNVTRAGQLPAMGIIPYSFKDDKGNDFREKAGNYYLKETAQIEEAKALLAKAGYPNAEGIPEIEIFYNTNDDNKAIAEAIQQMWTKIGIKATLRNQEWAVFQTERLNLKYDAVARHAWIGDYSDPQTFMDMFMTGNPQSGNGYASEDYDKYAKKAVNSLGEERYDNFYKAEQVLIDDAYVLPIYYYVSPFLINKDVVTGWYMSPSGRLWFGNATIVR